MALKPIAYVQASWHADIIDHCKTAFMAEITTRGYRVDEVEFFSAHGSLEIPLITKKLAKSGRYAAVCASGLVVDGVSTGRIRRARRAPRHRSDRAGTEVPVLSAVLTPHHFHAHAIHEEFFKEHMRTKGRELAAACVSIIEKLSALDARGSAPALHRDP